jgi:ABC-type amino acid transport system permease subunit
MADGRLEAIFRSWRMWTDDQPGLYAKVLAGTVGAPDAVQRQVLDTETAAAESVWNATRRYLPALAGAAAITLGLSTVSMAMAVALGILIASGRVHCGWC